MCLVFRDVVVWGWCFVVLVDLLFGLDLWLLLLACYFAYFGCLFCMCLLGWLLASGVGVVVFGGVCLDLMCGLLLWFADGYSLVWLFCGF